MRDHLQFYISDLKRRLYTDELTGLPNRNYFNQLSQEAKQCIIDEGKEPVLLFFDMIGLKYYNRQYGFSQGNLLLCEMAKILENHFGRDRIAHFGQGHFVAMSSEEEFRQKLKVIFQECQEINDGTGIPVRIGVYPYSLGDVDIGIACDRAKYASDRHRGAYLSNYYYFTESMQDKVENSRYILNNLDRAIQNNWIQVYYQPIIRAKSGLICDEEALARWFDPVKGFISPGEFIPVLEQARLIYKLDLYVLDQILLKMRAQEDAGLYVVPHSLNLSRIDFDECDIIEEILQRVDGAGIPRSKLTIEITESVVGSDFDFIKKQVLKLQSLGFSVWMDDFGSGYSSLDVLQDIHFDLIKFDMRFMHRFEEGDEPKIILTQLFEMTKALGIETITEGVETREQVEFLTEVGCTKLQGYYFSRPIPFDEILKQQRSDDHIPYENPDEN
jgi:diguanylate cyclase (GGDEF)-like protein